MMQKKYLANCKINIKCHYDVDPKRTGPVPVASNEVCTGLGEGRGEETDPPLLSVSPDIHSEPGSHSRLDLDKRLPVSNLLPPLPLLSPLRSKGK